MALSEAEARREAQDIVSDVEYEGVGWPRFLREPFERAAELLRTPLGWIGDLVDWIAGLVPGGEVSAWTLLALAVLGVATLVALRVTARAAAAEREEAALVDALAGRLDARALTRAADDAEARGAWDEAVRLRFRAGLADLDERGVLEVRPGTPTAVVARRLRSPAFREVAEGFAAVAYGGSAATQDDARAARDGWARVREEARPPDRGRNRPTAAAAT